MFRIRNAIYLSFHRYLVSMTVILEIGENNGKVSKDASNATSQIACVFTRLYAELVPNLLAEDRRESFFPCEAELQQSVGGTPSHRLHIELLEHPSTVDSVLRVGTNRGSFWW